MFILNNTFGLLLLIPLVLIFTILYFYFKPFKKREKNLFMMRIFCIILIIMGLAGITIRHIPKQTGTIFLADLSDSTEHHHQMMSTFIKEAIKSSGKDDLFAVMAFGNDTKLENTFDGQSVFNDFQVKIDSQFTNIEQALKQAQLMFYPDVKKRIVLLTDGRENVGDSIVQIAKLVEDNVLLDVVEIADDSFDEVQINALNLPKNVEKNAVFSLETQFLSNVKTAGEIYIYSGDVLAHKKRIDINIGKNAYVLNVQNNQGGIANYRVEIIADKDSYSQNNKLSTFTTVSDVPNVLIIQNKKDGINYANMFSEFNVVIQPAQSVSLNLENLMRFDAFVLANVSLEDVDIKLVENIERLVKEQGKGLLVSGGDNSFGLGGYYKTKLEKMLPVDMTIKDDREKEQLAMVLVIDKSGSMASGSYGVTQLSLAKEAAIRATEILEKKDYLGVIAFDDTVKWVIDLQNVTDKKRMQDDIATIVPGGGTTIKPSLEAAIESLENSNAALKHIILLTDGQDEKTGYEVAVNRLKKGKITLSTVAVGGGADRQLLKTLAELGIGRYYQTDVFTDIPSIFTKEAVLAGKKYLNNVKFNPKVAQNSQILNGIEALPNLDGYVATSVKPIAKAVLTGPDNDPILTTMQYGLGTTMAWTSDMKGMWSNDWLNWQDNQIFWTNCLSTLIRRDFAKNYTVKSEFNNGKGHIVLESNDLSSSQVPKIVGQLQAPDGKTEDITVVATAPGRYEGDFKPKGEGIYFANFSWQIEGDTERVITAVNVPYAKEYDFFSDKKTTASKMVRLSGGRVLDSPQKVFKGDLPSVVSRVEISHIFFALALCLFIIELIFRMTAIKIKMPKFIKKTNDFYIKYCKIHNKKSKKTSIKQDNPKNKDTVNPSKSDGYLDELLKNK